MINLRDPLAVLATRLPWDQIEAALAPMFAHRGSRRCRASAGVGSVRPEHLRDGRRWDAATPDGHGWRFG